MSILSARLARVPDVGAATLVERLDGDGVLAEQPIEILRLDIPAFMAHRHVQTSLLEPFLNLNAAEPRAATDALLAI